mmetsp:Transcript_38731/g.70319  ORF Transcript_38731/g.70319 Transcript_38731/m.70319 type:complete len:237 (+) Transcript_38731:1695-2405(+)
MFLMLFFEGADGLPMPESGAEGWSLPVGTTPNETVPFLALGDTTALRDTERVKALAALDMALTSLEDFGCTSAWGPSSLSFSSSQTTRGGCNSACWGPSPSFFPSSPAAAADTRGRGDPGLGDPGFEPPRLPEISSPRRSSELEAGLLLFAILNTSTSPIRDEDFEDFEDDLSCATGRGAPCTMLLGVGVLCSDSDPLRGATGRSRLLLAGDGRGSNFVSCLWHHSMRYASISMRC